MKKIKFSIIKEKMIWLIISLICWSSILITTSLLVTGWWQTLFISLGTGLAASAIVTFVFWRYQKEQEKRLAMKIRKDFMERAKILFYNLVIGIDFAKNVEKGEYTIEQYIKIQHRWFHEYYKKLVADNEVDFETEIRVQHLYKFLNENGWQIIEVLNTKNFDEGNFSDWEVRELKSLYDDYTTTKLLLENMNYKKSFLWFSSFLETFKRVISNDSFTELQNFELLKFSYNEEGLVTVIDNNFYDKESFLKFAKEFNQIRNENYKQYYGKESNVEENKNNG